MQQIRLVSAIIVWTLLPSIEPNYFASYVRKFLQQGRVEKARLPELHCTGSELSPVIRSVFHRYHNELRRKVAKGEYSLDGLLYGPASNMYELVYDCHMEDIARRSSKFGKIKEIGSKGSGKIKEFGVNLSKRDLPKDGMLLNVIEEVLFSWSVSGGLRQMIHFYTTRIGCYYSIAASKWSLEVICLYESKFKTDEILFEKGAACSHSNNCTLFSPSKCYDGLCAIVPQEQFYRNS